MLNIIRNSHILTRLSWKYQIFNDIQQISGTALFTIVFLDLPKKCINILRIFIEQSGNIHISSIPRTLYGNIPRNFIGNFFRIFWEYIMRMFHEYSTNNILGTLFGNIPRNFIANFFRISWKYIMGMFHEYSTNIYLDRGHWFGVPFPKLQTFSGIFWVLPIEYSLYKKRYLGFLFICLFPKLQRQK